MSYIAVCPSCQTKNRIPEGQTGTPVCGRCRTQLPQDSDRTIVEITDLTFDSLVLKAEKPVLVDFWAEWCRPCHMQAPIIKRLADTYSSIRVAKMDIDRNPQVPPRYQISAIPTLILFENGQAAKRITGVSSFVRLKSELTNWLK